MVISGESTWGTTTTPGFFVPAARPRSPPARKGCVRDQELADDDRTTKDPTALLRGGVLLWCAPSDSNREPID